MKNMKRALSLVLTMAMLLGMFLVPTGAASTTFTDADMIENIEAVEITSGIGLFAGTSDGQFAPKAAVTRAQMATIIVKMLRGNDFNADAFKGAGVNPFPDTAAFEGGWAEGYINACYQLGVVAGYGDGTFKPGNTLTTAEALTMIINALGVDPGPGEWPLTYMAKAEAMKLYGDLAVKPATNSPLTRDQLAVIVWEGLKYSPADSNGYAVTVDGKTFTFDNIADALVAAGEAGIAGITEVIGEDSLASKVYEIKTASGWITENQASGQECTVLTLATGAEEYYDVQTGVDMLGHYVTVYYKEQFKNEEEPGEVYTIVDESTVVTVKETIDSNKKYKAAFGKSFEISDIGFAFDDAYVADAVLSIPGYTAGSAAPKGTYIIAEGAIVAYIAPVTTYASYVSSISTVDGNEQVYLNGVAIPNAEGDDCVVEYEGMKSGDYVTYVMVGDIYVLSAVKKVAGTVTKTATTELNGENYDAITLDGTLYPAFEPKNASPSNNLVGRKLNNSLSALNYGQSYTLYVTEDGRYIGFESADGGVNVDDAVFLLGSIVLKEKDSYGKTAYYNKARGVDTSGKEVMITIGKALEVNGTAGYQDGEDAEALGTMYTLDTKGFYTVKDSLNKDEKKEGVQVVTAYQEAATAENPVYASRTYIAQNNWTGSSSIVVANGTHAYNKNSSVFIIISGKITDSEPLSATVHTGTMSPGVDLKYGEDSGYLLLTLNNIQSDIEVFVQIVAEEILKNKYAYITQDQLDAKSRTAEGYAYKVYDLFAGGEIEVVLDKEATQITRAGYVKLNVLEDDLYSAAESGVDLVDVITDASKNQSSDDIAVFISDVAFLGITAARMRFQRAAGTEGKAIDGYDRVDYNNSNAPNAAVVDLRTDEEILASGVGEITNMSQLRELVSNDPSMVVIMDIGMKGHYRSHSLNNVFIKRVVRDTVGLNSTLWLGEDAFGSDRNGDFATGLIVSSKTATMGETKKVYVDEVMDYGTGFYRYMVDADGDIKLVPFDNANVGGVFQGNLGMFGQHETIASIESVNGKLLMTTENLSHSCDFDCTNASFEARKDVFLTDNTQIYDATTGQWIEADTLAAMLDNGMVNVDVYCEGAIKANSSQTDRLTEKDSTVELLIITDKVEYPHSCDGNHDGWTELSPTGSGDITISQSGNYVLTADLTQKIKVASGADVKLCLCGHNITMDEKAFFDVSGALSVVNCNGKEGGNLTAKNTTSAQAVLINATGHLTIDEAVHITGCNGREVILNNGGTLIMEGGTIDSNVCTDRIVWLNGVGTFTMNGGTISGNKLEGTPKLSGTGNGGGVCLQGTGTFTMNGGVISGNSAAQGGGVYMNNGTFNMNGGVISGNSAAQGGGVFVNGGTFNMTGGTINGNTATTTTEWTQGGAGVHVAANGTFNMTGGSITGNSATKHGGGVFTSGTFNMSGGSIADNSVRGSNGSGVFVNGKDSAKGTFTMTGGSISGAINMIYIYGSKPVADISGGTLTGTGNVFVTASATAVVKLYGDVVVNGKIHTNAKGAYQITGGTFSVDPSAVLKTGYKAVADGAKFKVVAE